MFNKIQCIYCNKPLRIDKVYKYSDKYRITPKYAILNCKCSSYPVVEGILYLNKDKKKSCIIAALKQSKFDKSLYTLLISGNNILSRLLFFLSVKAKIFDFLSFNSLMRILIFLGFYKSICRYFLTRTKELSYYYQFLVYKLINRKSNTVVDLGSGAGHFLKELTSKVDAKNIYGLDRSFVNLFLARKYFASKKINLVCMEISRNLPFQKNSTNLIFLNDSFHYIKYKKNFIKEAHRINTKNGKLAACYITNKRMGNMRIAPISLHTLYTTLRSTGYKDSVLIKEEDLKNEISDGNKINLKHNYNKSRFRRVDKYSLFAAKKILPNDISLPETIYRKIVKEGIIN